MYDIQTVVESMYVHLLNYCTSTKKGSNIGLVHLSLRSDLLILTVTLSPKLIVAYRRCLKRVSSVRLYSQLNVNISMLKQTKQRFSNRLSASDLHPGSM